MEDQVFKNYPDFKEMLGYFASENFKGCLNDLPPVLVTLVKLESGALNLTPLLDQ